jgi:uncharacterized membrane-anchored protein
MKTLLSLCLIVGCAWQAFAEGQVKTREEAEALSKTLKYQQGEVVLRDGLATLRVPEGFRFLDGADANKVIVQLWGNPPGNAPLGMLMSESGPFGRGAWAVIISYEEDGYVKDHDAETIDYNALLKQVKEDIHKANPERTKQGYPAMELIGWAAPPRYDHDSHKLYWAKELKFGDEPGNTLNYNIRMLGRRGVMVLNAIASMSQLPQIESTTPKILSAIDFNPGNRYADFNPKSDKVATYGLAALVAGGIAAKLGFFKGLWLLILGLKKFIIIAAVAVAAWFKKLFGKKQPTGS